MTKRILHITRDLPPKTKGGISIATESLVKFLSENGHLNAVISCDNWRPRARAGEYNPSFEEQTSHASVLRISHQEHLEKARLFTQDFAPDLIHVHQEMIWPFVEELKKDLNIPVIVHMHVYHLEQNRVRKVDERNLSIEAQERALEFCDSILCPSEMMSDLILRDYPDFADKVEVLIPGFDDLTYADKSLSLRESKREKRLLYAGRFDWIKGTGEFFNSLPLILHNHEKLKIDIVGGVPGNSKAEKRWRKLLERNLTEFQKKQVQFHGWLDRDDFYTKLTEASIMLVPSRFETFGLSALEAMFFGLGIIACDAGNLGYMLKDRVTGLLIDANNETQISHAITRLIEDDNLLERLGKAAAEEARRTYLWDESKKKQYDSYYSSLIN